MEKLYHKYFSRHLNQPLEMNIYGRHGRPMLVFPTSDGRFYQFEDFGMIQPLQSWIDNEQLQVITIDGIDEQTWTAEHLPPHQQAQRYDDYDAALVHELLPYIRSCNSGHVGRNLIVAGCSFGAYHAANFFFRHPDLANGLIALSGVYDLEHIIGQTDDPQVYFHNPICYLPNLTDQRLLTLINDAHIAICCGQGAWEQPCLDDSRRLSAILNDKQIDHWLDLWGFDVAHDWYWWQKQLPYFLSHLNL